MMKFQTKEGKIFNAISFSRVVNKMEQGVLYIAKVNLDNEVWVVNNHRNEDALIAKAISFVKKFKLPVKISKIERFIDEFESTDIREITYEEIKDN